MSRIRIHKMAKKRVIGCSQFVSRIKRFCFYSIKKQKNDTKQLEKDGKRCRKNGKKLNIAHEIARQAIEYLTMCDRRVFIPFEINKLVVIFIGDVVVVVLWLYFIKMYPK